MIEGEKEKGKECHITVEELYTTFMVRIDSRLSTIENNIIQIDELNNSMNNLVTSFKQMKTKVEATDSTVDILKKRIQIQRARNRIYKVRQFRDRQRDK